ncbi:MAG: glutamine--fructose-6-phosphate transaminase (isomerizing) [Chloroflexi bacterium]|nr:glutamine--fructose-6-phosphate transaminase (isomerizing) [Chloroflexota bacterium]
MRAEVGMCGIYGYLGRGGGAASTVVEGLKRLEYRGYDSWGVAAVEGGHVALARRTGRVDAEGLGLPEGRSALGHTRWATHGGVTESNAHPHMDCNGTLALVHNGIVENAEELRQRLSARGHVFQSETDSEAIIHLVEEELRSAPSLHHAVLAAFCQLAGVNGVAVLDRSGERLVAATSGSPLVVALTGGEAHLASDPAALYGVSNQMIVLEDGQLAVIERETVRVMDMRLGSWVTPRLLPLEGDASDVTLGEGEHWMWREMAEQPRLLRLLSTDAVEEAARLAQDIRDATSVTWVGCGTAYHASLYARYVLAAAGERSHAVPGSEFAFLADAVGPGGLLLALSQSGETIDILDALHYARKQGARVTALVNAGWSTLARLADSAVRLRAGPERCVLATKSFLAKVGIITLIEAALLGDMASGQRALRDAADTIEEILGDRYQGRIIGLAERVANQEHLYCLGRGRSTAIALEAALKIKEGSYLHAEGFSSGELKHGVIALISAGTPCLLLAPADGSGPALIAAAMEVRARGAFTIGIAQRVHAAFDEVLPVMLSGPGWWLAAAVVAQTLAYRVALLRGHDPDRPRNLAKSVTVR